GGRARDLSYSECRVQRSASCARESSLVEGRLCRRHQKRNRNARKRSGSQIEVICADIREPGRFAANGFVGEEVERLVLLDRSAERRTRLNSRVGLLHSGEIHRIGCRIENTLHREWVSRLKVLLP